MIIICLTAQPKCTVTHTFIPPPTALYPLINMFSISVSLYFGNKFICIYIFKYYTYKQYHIIFVWLTLLGMIVKVHVAANGVISFFFMAE